MEKNKENPGVQNPAHALVKRLQENRKSLHIARVPDKTKTAFMNLADEEFCGDYGMTLKWLIDDILSLDNRMIIAKLEEQETRIQALESTTPSGEEKPNEDVKKMLDGKKKVVRRSEKK